MIDFTDPKTLQDWLDVAKGSAGAAKDIAGLAKKLKDFLGKAEGTERSRALSPEVREMLVELLDKAVTAKEEAVDLKTRLLEVTQELSRIQQFNADRQSYRLVELRAGSFAYRASSPGQDHEPAREFCAHCFEQAKRVVTLQLKQRDFNVDTLHCTICGGDVFKPNDVKAEVWVRGKARGPMVV